MAKRKRRTQSRKQTPAAGQPEADSDKPADILGSLCGSLKAAGQAAERYARMGINMAETEALRLKLKAAYAALGENVVRCWDAAPDLGVASTDPAVKPQVKAVNDLRRQIRETEVKLKNLKQS